MGWKLKLLWMHGCNQELFANSEPRACSHALKWGLPTCRRQTHAFAAVSSHFGADCTALKVSCFGQGARDYLDSIPGATNLLSRNVELGIRLRDRQGIQQMTAFSERNEMGTLNGYPVSGHHLSISRESRPRRHP